MVRRRSCQSYQLASLLCRDGRVQRRGRAYEHPDMTKKVIASKRFMPDIEDCSDTNKQALDVGMTPR